MRLGGVSLKLTPGLLAEIFDDRRRISNPGFARDVHQRLLVDDADGAPAEHRVAEARGHSTRGIDSDAMLLE